MSSGEKAKPPFEERNPFDISRRSGPEVAAEIAKRMSAWKQARARTAAPSTTIPGGEAKFAGGKTKLETSLSGSAAKSLPIAAPVQPARMPQPAPAAARNAGGAAPRVPYFASASATRRAMPPAPSLKQGSARPNAPASDDLADEPAVATPHHDEAPAPLGAAAPIAATSIEEVPDRAEAAPSEFSHAVEAPVAELQEPAVAEADDTERQRAEARAIKARWMAAHDLDALLDTAAADKAPMAAHATDSAVDTSQPQLAVAGNPESPSPDEQAGETTAFDQAPRDETADPAEVTADAADRAVATERTIGLAALNEMAGRKEPTFDAPVAPAIPETTEEMPVITVQPPMPSDATDVRAEADDALSIAALDEIAGRREPAFDQPVARKAAEIEPPVRSDTPAPEAPMESIAARSDAPGLAVAPEDARVEAPHLSIAALDEAAGRREPTFDQPVSRKAPEIEPPLRVAKPLPELEAPIEPGMARSGTPVSDTPAEDGRADEAPALSIAALDEAAGRKEPTFDEPLPGKPAAAKPAEPRIKLRPIETRIEARRVDTLRADPQLSVRRPIFPHIEPEEWDVPPAVAARTNRERRSTGWAIGLGSVLLIAGITAPAAIWQQGRQAVDQVAQVSPQPAAPTSATQVPAQATLPEAPQPEAAPTVSADNGTPAVQQETPPAPAVATPSTAKAEGDQAADPKPANRQPATTLSAINEGGDVNAAPVVTPPPPTVNLASKTDPAGAGAPMVARPFVPQGGDGPFLRAPTTGAASVPVAGAPPQSAAVGVKPSLMVQLKPAKTVAAAKPVTSKPRPATRKPKPFFQQSPDQMFQTLIDTLSEGKPVNPATKPVAPSNRK